MECLAVCLVAVLVSALTLFSGFGLGPVLMPAFALFFPVPVAIAATAVVHLANNIFKMFLVGRKADWSIVTCFAIPGAIPAMIGAALLDLVADHCGPDAHRGRNRYGSRVVLNHFFETNQVIDLISLEIDHSSSS